MATASPLHYPDAAPVPSSDGLGAEHFLPYAQKLEREHPEHLRAIGMTAEDYAAALAEPGLTLDESVAAGLMSAEEARFLLGEATREDLVLLGYSPEEMTLSLECSL